MEQTKPCDVRHKVRGNFQAAKEKPEVNKATLHHLKVQYQKRI